MKPPLDAAGGCRSPSPQRRVAAATSAAPGLWRLQPTRSCPKRRPSPPLVAPVGASLLRWSEERRFPRRWSRLRSRARDREVGDHIFFDSLLQMACRHHLQIVLWVKALFVPLPVTDLFRPVEAMTRWVGPPIETPAGADARYRQHDRPQRGYSALGSSSLADSAVFLAALREERLKKSKRLPPVAATPLPRSRSVSRNGSRDAETAAR